NILTLHIRVVTLTIFHLIPAFLGAGLVLGTVIAPLLNVILAGVPGRDAGSASGVLGTFQQLGGAIGLAVVGVVFFGMLSSRAPTVVATVNPQLHAQLADAHVPPATAAAAVPRFTRCFDEQASASDPTQPIPGCPSTTKSASANPVTSAITAAAKLALARDFVTSVERILFFNVGFLVVTGLLSLLLPRVRVAAAAAH